PSSMAKTAAGRPYRRSPQGQGLQSDSVFAQARREWRCSMRRRLREDRWQMCADACDWSSSIRKGPYYAARLASVGGKSLLAQGLVAALVCSSPARATSFTTDQSDIWSAANESGWAAEFVQRGSKGRRRRRSKRCHALSNGR